jgi:hypothetical protein
MELEKGEVTCAAHGERSRDRLVQRNGCRDRDWQTWAGTVELRIAMVLAVREVPSRASFTSAATRMACPSPCT